MPLIKSQSAAALRRNIAELVKAGYKPTQAYAIAKDTQGKAKTGSK